MRHSSYGLSKMQFWIIAVCFMLAIALLAAAFWEPKKPASEGWVPLNAAVETALAELKQPVETASTEHETAGAAGRGIAAAEDKAGEDVRDMTAAADEGTAALETASTMEAAAGDRTTGSKNTEANGKPDMADNIPSDGRLDINRATVVELDALKGIGPAKAQAIVADRERNGMFTSARDLLRVKGIGEKLLAGIEESIVAHP
ncbi:ComEA family DNA-binding protein [Paenibacillus sp. sgz302251]|uniref:ComEA family DNA-binding protein n=1 Tax=Paenibacillus sp. sgz302251 TaxID=3414493 RepID=UPI003C7A334E